MLDDGVTPKPPAESWNDNRKRTGSTPERWELFAAEAVKLIQQRDASKPMFLYVPFNAPHSSSALEPRLRSSVQAPKEFKRLYPAVKPEFRTTEKYRYGGPAQVVTSAARRRDYRAAVTCMDAAIGKMLDRLEERGLLDQTIVIFFSDNGGWSWGAFNHVHEEYIGMPQTSCLPLKGGIAVGKNF